MNTTKKMKIIGSLLLVSCHSPKTEQPLPTPAVEGVAYIIIKDTTELAMDVEEKAFVGKDGKRDSLQEELYKAARKKREALEDSLTRVIQRGERPH